MRVFASTPAFDADVAGMTCSEIASFAQEVAQQKAEGVTVNKALRRLRHAFGVQQAETEHELEKILQAIYQMRIFSTVSPEEVSRAYQAACEHG